MRAGCALDQRRFGGSLPHRSGQHSDASGFGRAGLASGRNFELDGLMPVEQGAADKLAVMDESFTAIVAPDEPVPTLVIVLFHRSTHCFFLGLLKGEGGRARRGVTGPPA
jgi:hypothetical protein